MFGVRYAFKQTVRSSQERKCHFGTIDKWRKSLVVALSRLAEKHGLDAAAGAQSFLDQPDPFHAGAAGLRLQSAAQSHAKFLEPAIVATGNRGGGAVRGARVPGGLYGGSHQWERSKLGPSGDIGHAVACEVPRPGTH